MSYKGAVMRHEAIHARDRNIAENLEHAKETIRGIYPSFEGKDPLRLTLQIGYLHNPEAMSRRSIEVIDLSGGLTRGIELASRIDRLIGEGKSVDKLEPLLKELSQHRYGLCKPLHR